MAELWVGPFSRTSICDEATPDELPSAAKAIPPGPAPMIISSYIGFVIWEERVEHLPCSGLRRLLPPPNCCRFDARSGMARTSPTTGARRARSRSYDRAPPSHGGGLQVLGCQQVATTRAREAASLSPVATTRFRPDPETKRTRSRNDLPGRVRRRVGSPQCC